MRPRFPKTSLGLLLFLILILKKKFVLVNFALVFCGLIVLLDKRNQTSKELMIFYPNYFWEYQSFNTFSSTFLAKNDKNWLFFLKKMESSRQIYDLQNFDTKLTNAF